MEPFFFDNIRAKFQSSKWIAVVLFVGWFLWEAFLHAVFTWFNEHIAMWISHMSFLGIIIKWTSDNPIQFLIILGISYCLIVIITAYISPSLTIQFGVYWDNNGNPFCPSCKIPLSMTGAGNNILRCVRCK